VSLLLVSNPTIQFAAYSQTKWLLLQAKGPKGQLNSLDFFVIASLAKILATLCTYPLQLAQSRLRAKKADASAKGKPPKYGSTFLVLWQILTTEGFAALYKGLESKIVQTVLTAAFTFLTYEKTVELLKALVQQRRAVA